MNVPSMSCLGAMLVGVAVGVTSAAEGVVTTEGPVKSRMTVAKEMTVPREYVSPDGGVFRYRWHEPAALQTDEKYPLVILMHGAGERGTNNVSQLYWGADEIVSWFRARGEEFYFVAGQVPEGLRWVEVDWAALGHTMPSEPSETMARQIVFLEELLSKTPAIDRTRIYVTGISMGGYGTWDILCRKPEWFAAAMPICGGADETQAWRLREIPIWVFHGDQDRTVPFVRSRRMTAALWACDGNVKYTEYPGVAHDSWIPAYGDKSNLDWLFHQRKRARDISQSGNPNKEQ